PADLAAAALAAKYSAALAASAMAVPRVNTSGGIPSSRNRATSAGNLPSPFRSYHGKPVTTVCGGQSGCLSMMWGENKARWSIGACPSVSGFTVALGGRPISFRKRYQGVAQKFVAHLRKRRSGTQKAGPRKRSVLERNAKPGSTGGS